MILAQTVFAQYTNAADGQTDRAVTIAHHMLKSLPLLHRWSNKSLPVVSPYVRVNNYSCRLLRKVCRLVRRTRPKTDVVEFVSNSTIDILLEVDEADDDDDVEVDENGDEEETLLVVVEVVVGTRLVGLVLDVLLPGGRK